MRRRLDGWDSWQRQTDDGAIESQQRVELRAPVVEFSVAGAQTLGRVYWREVEHLTLRLVRARAWNGSLELRLFANGPVLLRFGPPALEAGAELASCSYAIEGGLLARRAAGEIVFAQVGSAPATVSSTIRGFFPRLAAREGEPDWTGALYKHVQSRIHLSVSRRYFARLIAGAGA